MRGGPPSLEAALRAAYTDLNGPSAAQLQEELRRRGVRLPAARVRDFVRAQAERQVFAPATRFARDRGRIVATLPNQRWFADLIDNTAQPAPGGERYVLVVQDVFTRRLFTEALRDKRPQTVAAALGRLMAVHGVPGDLESDAGAEFGAPLRELAARLGFHVFVKDPADRNAHGTLDRAIGTLRLGLARAAVAAGGSADWAALLPKATRAYNRTPHSRFGLLAAPEDVEGDKVLRFFLERQAAQDFQVNLRVHQTRVARLRRDGAFRVPLPGQGLRHRSRIQAPRWSPEVHLLKALEQFDAFVVDEHGKRYRTQDVLPVPRPREGAAPARLPERAGGRGSALTDAARLRALEPFRDALEDFLATPRSLSAVVAELRRHGAAEVLQGLRGLNYVGALRLLGFQVRESGKAGAATVERGAMSWLPSQLLAGT